eukprot:scaffold41308_cov40-Prasinocladus_malaysianus.AAC.1
MQSAVTHDTWVTTLATKCALEWAACMHAQFWGRRASNAASGLWEVGTYWTLEKRRKELEDMEWEWEKTLAAFK